MKGGKNKSDMKTTKKNYLVENILTIKIFKDTEWNNSSVSPIRIYKMRQINFRYQLREKNGYNFKIYLS